MASSTKRFRRRLEGRAELNRADALRTLIGEITVEVEALAQLLELDVGVPIGLLRPDDRIDEVFAPFRIGNPLTWMRAEARLEDGLSEVRYQLSKRLDARGAATPAIRTVRDLFVVWCGKEP